MQRMLDALEDEAAAFAERRKTEIDEAAVRFALAMHFRTDVEAVKTMSPAEKTSLASRIIRALRRERLKGLKSHWGYDLNRHIGLKKALAFVARAEENAADGACRRLG